MSKKIIDCGHKDKDDAQYNYRLRTISIWLCSKCHDALLKKMQKQILIERNLDNNKGSNGQD